MALRCVAALSLLAVATGRFQGFRRGNVLHDPPQGAESEELWFTQRLDHFNGADSRVWKQRYFTNDAFYQPGGPVFLMIGGEGPANPAWMKEGTWLTYAKEVGALCFLLEHRFYGKSHPTTLKAAPRSSVERSCCFSSSSSSVFIMDQTSLQQSSDGGRIVGGSSSLCFSEYLEVVWRSLASESADCPVLVKQASDALAERLKDPKTFENITKDFKLCSPLQIQSESDSAYFLETLAGNFMDVVQYNEDNRGFEGVPGTNVTIKVLCGVMGNTSMGDPYSRYVAVARLMMDTFSMKCLDSSFNNYVRDMTNTSWDGPAAGGGRQWVYQTCSEFGFYQSTDSPNQPFTGFPVGYQVKQCARFYNISAEEVAEAVAQTNEYYGGYNIRSSRIVFPNGSVDPWHALGITQDITAELPAVFIKGTAHCANMYPARSQDLPQLSEARDHVLLLLQQWLKR
ncbi:PREDICTED: putative serine protease K12H4.7 [Cyprinodon variegatus]|uniref:putative serine protease K12H4.7 n=1 Tax=Cyprinodon variegatus TaxID=28743 RepID=UPI000742A2C2|nr:PREDICTED: putative serine protease K12H4.7 [Cyprinodon variegatus]